MICTTGLVMEYHSYVGGLAYYYSDPWSLGWHLICSINIDMMLCG